MPGPAQATITTSPAPDRSELERRGDAVLQELHEDGGFPGGSAALVLASGSTITATVGVAAAGDDRPLRPEDRMLSGSIGKTFVAAAALHLVHEAKLEHDAKAERWLGDEEWCARLPTRPR